MYSLGHGGQRGFPKPLLFPTIPKRMACGIPPEENPEQETPREDLLTRETVLIPPPPLQWFPVTGRTRTLPLAPKEGIQPTRNPEAPKKNVFIVRWAVVSFVMTSLADLASQPFNGQDGTHGDDCWNSGATHCPLARGVFLTKLPTVAEAGPNFFKGGERSSGGIGGDGGNGGRVSVSKVSRGSGKGKVLKAERKATFGIGAPGGTGNPSGATASKGGIGLPA